MQSLSRQLTGRADKTDAQFCVKYFDPSVLYTFSMNTRSNTELFIDISSTIKQKCGRYNNGEMHRYTADQMSEKFGMDAAELNVSVPTEVEHHRRGRGFAVLAFNNKSEVLDVPEPPKQGVAHLPQGEPAAGEAQNDAVHDNENEVSAISIACATEDSEAYIHQVAYS